MFKTLLETLNNAYCSDNPFKCLQDKVKHKEFGTYYTNQMLPKRIEQGDNIEIKEEIESYRNKNHEDSSDVTLKYIYCYFGSSICHLFGNLGDNLQFYPDQKCAVIAYSPVTSNTPLPYLWFDINKNGTKIKLVRQKNIHAEYIKVKVTDNLTEKPIAKQYINLKNKQSIVSSRGSFIHISMPDGKLLKSYCEKQDSIILITIDGAFINMYHQLSKCFVACHYISYSN